MKKARPWARPLQSGRRGECPQLLLVEAFFKEPVVQAFS